MKLGYLKLTDGRTRLAALQGLVGPGPLDTINNVLVGLMTMAKNKQDTVMLCKRSCSLEANQRSRTILSAYTRDETHLPNLR